MPFTTLGLPASIVKGVRAAGFIDPTPIQLRAIPIILRGHDLIAAAERGTGKTAAYLLPTLARLLESPRRLGAVVLTPSRELAAKIETRARDYARFTNLRIAVVFGGAPIQTQERQLRYEGVDLLVATPGRLLELHARQAMSFEDVEMLVLDEGDRIVGLGFAPDLRRILKLLPETRQTLLFSATMPPELNRVAKEALVEPIRVDLAPQAQPAAGITEAIYPVTSDLKTDLLDEMLSRSEARSVIVFTRSQHRADRLARQLSRRGSTVATLHGNRSQSERERALDDLKRGRVQILVATDIASRGIEVDGIPHVVNFDVPQTPEDYVHRLGRNGRTALLGDAFTLMSPEEQEAVTTIERFLGRAVPRVLLPDFDYRMHPTVFHKVVSYEESSGAQDTNGDGRAAQAAPAARGGGPRKPAASRTATAKKRAKPARPKPASASSGRTAKSKPSSRRARARR
ncbi:MAG TPA: DEAD/DEAH box helicase [Candidatus Limnocylindria bacterium]|nr:DEAD/DEAH box helicase [Candidatus Limnocylindria bacterium]